MIICLNYSTRNLNKLDLQYQSIQSVQKRSDEQPYDRASEVYRGKHVRSQDDIYSEEIICDQFDFEDVSVKC